MQALGNSATKKTTFMATLAYKLDTRSPHKDGAFPLVITLSHLSRTVRISTGFSFTEDEWASSLSLLRSTRHKPRREAVIEQFKLKLDAALSYVEESMDVSLMSPMELRDRIVARAKDKDYHPERHGGSPLFLPYYRERMSFKETEGTRKIYAFTLKLIERFEQENGRDPEMLSFKAISPAWLLAFDNWMGRTNGENSRSKNMRNIRSVLNDAIEEGMSVEYPFSKSSSKRRGVVNDGKRKFRIVSSRRTQKRNLTTEQFRILRDYPCAPFQEKYRDLFLLMVYLVGINAVDLFSATPDQIVNGRLEYDRAKTHKPYSIKIEPEAAAIIEKYKGTRLLLEPCEHYKRYEDFLHHMNDALKTIGYTYNTRQQRVGKPLFPKLSSYWARHTWSSIAIEAELSRDVVGRSLGHSWAEDTVTDIYINFGEKRIDQANRRLLDYIAGKQQETIQENT